jgi:hypothetical protein
VSIARFHRAVSSGQIFQKYSYVSAASRSRLRWIVSLSATSATMTRFAAFVPTPLAGEYNSLAGFSIKILYGESLFDSARARSGFAGLAAQAGVGRAAIKIRSACQGWRISSVASLYNLPSFPFAYSAKEAAISPAEASTTSASAWPRPK